MIKGISILTILFVSVLASASDLKNGRYICNVDQRFNTWQKIVFTANNVSEHGGEIKVEELVASDANRSMAAECNPLLSVVIGKSLPLNERLPYQNGDQQHAWYNLNSVNEWSLSVSFITIDNITLVQASAYEPGDQRACSISTELSSCEFVSSEISY